jgi:DNA repair protein RadC
MVPTTFVHISSLFRPRRVRINSHPDAVSEASLNLPRRIDDPTSAAQLTRDLLLNHREDITMALYLDDRHRLAAYRRYGAPSATEGEDRSFRTIAAACSRYGVVVADQAVVVG